MKTDLLQLLLGCLGLSSLYFCWDYVWFCWVVLGLCWVSLGCLWPILGLCCLPRVASGLRLLYFRFTLDHLGTSWAYVGPSWDYVECCWGQCCAILALCWPILRPSWDYVGTMLGFVGSSCAYVCPSWDYVGRSWVLCWDILALCWPILGPCCAVVGLCRTKKGRQSAKKPVFHGICSVFLHIARFRPTSLETTKTTQFGSRAG